MAGLIPAPTEQLPEVPPEQAPGITGLVPDKQSTGGQYDDLVGVHPGLAPVAGTEEPTDEETMHFHEIFADFIDKIHGDSKQQVIKSLKTASELYKGVAKTAFEVLKAVYTEYTQKEGVDLGSVLFGQGGMISTAVDEVFQIAIALGLPGTNDEQQYSAAQFEVMRLVGEYLRNTQEDDSVDQAQELMLDMDEAGGASDSSTPLNSEDRNILEEASAPPPPPEEPQVSPEAQAAVPADGSPIASPQPAPPPPQGLV